MIFETLLWLCAGFFIIENARLRRKLRTPRLEFDCDDDRHMWGQVEKVKGGKVHWYQGRSCQLCGLEQIHDGTRWGISRGAEK